MKDYMMDKRSRDILVLFLLALLIRFLIINTNQVAESDEMDYIFLATNLATNNKYSYPLVYSPEPDSGRAPMLPYILSIVYFLHPDKFLFMKIFNIICGSFVVFTLYMITEKIFGRKAALVSSFFSIFIFELMSYSVHVLTETLFAFVTLQAIYWTYKAKNKKDFMVVGFFCALSYLTRMNGLLLFIVISICILFRDGMNRKVVLNVLVIALIFFSCISPWLYRNYVFFGNPLFSRLSYITLWMGNNPMDSEFYFPYGLGEVDVPSTQLSQLYLQGALEYISSDIPAFVFRTSKRILWYIFLILELFSFLPSLFVILGFVLLLSKIKKYLIFYLWPTYNILHFSLLFVFTRYLVPLIPIFLIFLGYGLVYVNEKFGKRVFYGVISIIFVLIFYSTLGNIALQDESFELKQAGEYLHNKEDTSIISRGEVAYYAEKEYLSHVGNYSELIDISDQFNISYIVIDSIYTSRYYPSLEFLFDEEQIPDDLLLEKEFQGDRGRVLIFRRVR